MGPRETRAPQGTSRVPARRWLVVAVGAALVAACSSEPAASEGDDQRAWGEAMFAHHCVRCHADDRTAPALRAQELLAGYDDAHDLYTIVQRTMPLDDPGSLPEEDALAATAYLLDREDLFTLPAEERLTTANAGAIDLGQQPLELEPGPDLEEGDRDGDTG
jgi:mono/diheme cytochrome c family protein